MAIHTKQGKSRSQRTAEELEDELDRLLGQATPAEVEALRILIQDEEARNQEGAAPEETLVHQLRATEFVREPVDIETFVRDDYFLGDTCDSLYPEYVTDLEVLFSGNYQECILTGAIGTGKTFLASVGICRILYELSCMHNPQRTFGIASGSNISIVCMSVTESLAVRVAYDNIATKIAPSKYFQQHFPFERTKKELRFPNNIWVAARASNDSSALGLNVVASLLDETDFYKDPLATKKDPGTETKAAKLYAQLRRRMKSRFERHGRLPGIMFVVSSKNTNDDFTQKRIAAAKDDPTVFVRDRSLWDVKSEVYSKERFHVLCGNESTPSKILTEEEHTRYSVEGAPDGVIIVEVPVDFRPDFESDLEGSIRDLAGISTVAVHPYIQQREKIVSAVDPNLVHPFSTEVYDMGSVGSFLWGSMVRTGNHGEPIPIINPRASRHIHIDTSLRKDATGFAMGHIAGYVDVMRRGQDGTAYPERAPVFVMDLLLRIVPPAGREIILADIRHLVYELAAHGYKITHITLDSHQSADTIQQLNARGFDTQLLSVDIRPEPYDATKTALYENRLRYYAYDTVLRELRQLEEHHTGRVRKIDHPRGGSKDVSDALTGVIYSLQQLGAYEEPLPMLSSSRGYPVPLPQASMGMPALSQGGYGSAGALPLPFLGGSGRFGFGSGK